MIDKDLLVLTSLIVGLIVIFTWQFKGCFTTDVNESGQKMLAAFSSRNTALPACDRLLRLTRLCVTMSDYQTYHYTEVDTVSHCEWRSNIPLHRGGHMHCVSLWVTIEHTATQRWTQCVTVSDDRTYRHTELNRMCHCEWSNILSHRVEHSVSLWVTIKHTATDTEQSVSLWVTIKHTATHTEQSVPLWVIEHSVTHTEQSVSLWVIEHSVTHTEQSVSLWVIKHSVTQSWT